MGTDLPLAPGEWFEFRALGVASRNQASRHRHFEVLHLLARAYLLGQDRTG